MAHIECSQWFQGVHRKPDEPFYNQAFTDLLSLHADGIIEGPFILSIGDKQGSADVFVTVWRDAKIFPDSGWIYEVDNEGNNGLVHRYTKAFNPGASTPDEIVFAFKQLLFCPFQESAKCAKCREPIGPDGECRMFGSGVGGAGSLIRMLPLCKKHLDERDAE
jgi:hypothetical protein